jgi:hypothetical protein
VIQKCTLEVDFESLPLKACTLKVKQGGTLPRSVGLHIDLKHEDVVFETLVMLEHDTGEMCMS